MEGRPIWSAELDDVDEIDASCVVEDSAHGVTGRLSGRDERDLELDRDDLKGPW